MAPTVGRCCLYSTSILLAKKSYVKSITALAALRLCLDLKNVDLVLTLKYLFV